MKLTKKAKKLKNSYWIVFLVAITGSWFVWKTWDKVDSILPKGAYYFAGLILIVAILFGVGHWSFKKLAKMFT